jgi:hypothetical protein
MTIRPEHDKGPRGRSAGHIVRHDGHRVGFDGAESSSASSGRTQGNVARVYAPLGSVPTRRDFRLCQALHVAVAFPPSAAVYPPRHGVASEAREGRAEGA